MALNKQDKLLKKLQKDFGEEEVRRFSDIPPIPRISSGLAMLDLAIGGGIPMGRIIEIFGPEHSGKTTLALHILKQFQKRNGTVLYIDTEGTLDSDMATQMGIQLESVLILQTNKAELAFSVAKLAAEEGCHLIIIDSIAGLRTSKQIQGDPGDITVAELARFLGAQLPVLNGLLKENEFKIKEATKGENLVLSKDREPLGTTLVLINQERDSIGGYTPTKVTPGGSTLKFYATLRLRISSRQITNSSTGVVNRVESKFYIKKNKVGKPSGYVEAEINCQEKPGFDELASKIRACVELNIIEKKAGGNYLLPRINEEGEKEKIRGLPNLIEVCTKDESFMNLLDSELEKAYEQVANSKLVIKIQTAYEEELNTEKELSIEEDLSLD